MLISKANFLPLSLSFFILEGHGVPQCYWVLSQLRNCVFGGGGCFLSCVWFASVLHSTLQGASSCNNSKTRAKLVPLCPPLPVLFLSAKVPKLWTLQGVTYFHGWPQPHHSSPPQRRGKEPDKVIGYTGTAPYTAQGLSHWKILLSSSFLKCSLGCLKHLHLPPQALLISEKKSGNYIGKM